MNSVSWKLFWSVVGAAGSGALAGIAVLAGLSTWIPVTAAFALAVLTLAVARMVVMRARMFERLEPAAQSTIVTWIGVAVAAYAGWVIAFVVKPSLWALWLLVLVGLGVLTYLVAWGNEYLLTKLRRSARVHRHLALSATAAIAPAPYDDDPERALMRRVLARCGMGWLTVVSHGPVTDTDGHRFGTRYKCRRPSRITVTADGGKAKQQVAPKIPTDAGDRIAVALSELTGRDYASDWVAITDDENAAGVHYIQVNTEDIMAKPRPYFEDEATLTWASVDEPAPIGYGIDGQRFYLELCQHGRLIGGTQKGKSSAIHRLIAHLTLCEDVIVWAASVEKFYDMVASWVDPYLNTGIRPPIDWLAATHTDLLDVLIAAMNVARWRQKQPMARRRGFKKLFVILDEFSFAARNTAVTGTYQGQRVTIGLMIAMLAQGAASAGVYVIIATQRGTYDHLGDYGGDVASNMGWSAGFRSSDHQDTGRVIGDWKLPKIRHKGQVWIEPGSGEPPVSVKLDYIQTDDPRQPVLSNGPTVSQVSQNRRQFQRDLDPGSATAAGEAYARRHRYVTDELIAYLTGTSVDEHTEPEPTAEDAGYTATLTLLRQRVPALANITDQADQAEQGGTGRGAAGEAMSVYRTRADRIRQIIRDAGPAGIERGEIIAKLRADGDDIPALGQAVQNELTRLVNAGEVTKPDRGRYVAIEYTTAAAPQ